MNTIRYFITTTAALIFASSISAGELKTLISGSAPADTLTLATGDSAKLTFAARTHLPAGFTPSDVSFTVTVPGRATSFTVQNKNNPGFEFAGPATIKVESFDTNANEPNIATFMVSRAADIPSVTPSNAAVIPEDQNGQYQVILEGSTDLITWTAANPGNYSGTTSKRFFRTRIVKQ